VASINCRRAFFLPGGSTRAFPLCVVHRTVILQDLTWIELRDSVAKGYTTAIIPIGGTEQSGPAMALGKHNVRAAALSQEIAAKLGNRYCTSNDSTGERHMNAAFRSCSGMLAFSDGHGSGFHDQTGWHLQAIGRSP